MPDVVLISGGTAHSIIGSNGPIECTVVESIEALIAAAQADQHTLAIVDFPMPGLDPIRLIRVFRSIRTLDKTKLMVVLPTTREAVALTSSAAQEGLSVSVYSQEALRNAGIDAIRTLLE